MDRAAEVRIFREDNPFDAAASTPDAHAHVITHTCEARTDAGSDSDKVWPSATGNAILKHFLYLDLGPFHRW